MPKNDALRPNLLSQIPKERNATEKVVAGIVAR